MKGKRLSLAAAISLSLFTLWGLESCSKSNSSYQSDGTLTATVNGTAFSAKSYVVAGYLGVVGDFLIRGDSITNKDTTEFQITMPHNFPVNQAVQIDSIGYAGNLYIAYKTAGKEYDVYYGLDASHGFITLTSEDTVGRKLAGTFNGVLYNMNNSSDSVVVTNGVFSTNYELQ